VKRSTLLTSSLACLLCASPASAQLHQSDVALRVVDDATGSGVRQMQTGWYNPCAQALSFPHRIFVTRLGDFDTINDPGFDAESGSLPPNTKLVSTSSPPCASGMERTSARSPRRGYGCGSARRATAASHRLLT